MNQFIWQKKNCLSEEFCKNLIEKFEKDDRKVSGTTDLGLISDLKKSTDLYISQLDGWAEEDKIFFDVLSEQYQNYLNFLSKINPKLSEYFNFGNVSDTGYQIQKTIPGEFYDWHVDSSASLGYNYLKERGVRVATFIWYLNDIDHEGETEFIDGTKIKPETGKMLIFPSTITYLHRGVSPKCETKYICTGWMHCKPK